MLDGIVETLRSPTVEPALAAAAALTLARAGRSADQPFLFRLADRLRVRGEAEAAAVRLAAALCTLRPPPKVERADAGYRFTADDGDVLFVDDPVAAHWHHAGRWGPPLRPDLDRAPRLATGAIEPLVADALDGAIVVVGLEGGGGPALRVTRAGISRDASLRSIVRWPQVSALRLAERGQRRRVELVLKTGAPERLDGRPTIPHEALLELLAQVRRGALSSHRGA